jgi:RNase P/RNase MRP subunit p30
MKKYFDIVSEKLIDNYNFNKLEDLFIEMGYSTVYITRKINNKNDLQLDFHLPKTKKIKLEKAYMFKDVDLFNKYSGDDLVLCKGGDAKQNKLLVSNKKTQFLFDPISSSLSFDEQNSRVCNQKNISIIFDINKVRGNYTLSALKQMMFLTRLLKIHMINMHFVSYAKKPEDLIHIKILESLLLNFDLSEDTIGRFLCQLKIK